MRKYFKETKKSLQNEQNKQIYAVKKKILQIQNKFKKIH